MIIITIVVVIIIIIIIIQFKTVKVKGHTHNKPKGPKGVPGRLRLRIFLTFGTTRVVGRQPHAPAAFTPQGKSLVLIFRG
jgi:heme/copper-type cytochrome/quinol oxidase subunit 2